MSFDKRFYCSTQSYCHDKCVDKGSSSSHLNIVTNQCASDNGGRVGSKCELSDGE